MVFLGYVAGLLVFCGSAVGLYATVGSTRLKGFFEEVHLLGAVDSLSVFLVMLGLVLEYITSMIAFKIIVMMLIMFFTASVATSLLAGMIPERDV